VLHEVLAKYLPGDGSRIEFTCNAYGKPSLDPRYCDIRFNMSHTRDLVLIGVTRGREIGVDIEYIDPAENWDPVLEGMLEADPEIGAVPDALTRRIAFYRQWVRKEAYLKALGTGLGCPVSESLIPPAGWRVEELPLEGYRAALAVEAGPLDLQRFEVQGEPDAALFSPVGLGRS